MELQGKTAFVTGSGRGIGEGIALVLAPGGKVLAVAADVSKKAEVNAMAAATIAHFTDAGTVGPHGFTHHALCHPGPLPSFRPVQTPNGFCGCLLSIAPSG